MRVVLPLLLLFSACNDHADPLVDECLAPNAGIGRELRNPSTGECVMSGFEPCNGDGSNAGDVTWADCAGPCSNLAEADCLDRADCRAIYGETTTVFVACWGTTSGSGSTADCAELQAVDCSRRDDCAAVHVEYCGNANCTVAEFAACMAEPTS